MPFHHLVIPGAFQLAGQVLPAILAPRPRSVGPQVGYSNGGNGSIQQAALPLGPAVAGVGSLAVRGAATAVRLILGKASQYIGRRITAKQAVALARRVGPEAAAVALGISAAEMLQLIATEATRRRRRRGITARAISQCRSTIRRMQSFNRMLGRGMGGGGVRRHGHRVVSFRRK